MPFGNFLCHTCPFGRYDRGSLPAAGRKNKDSQSENKGFPKAIETKLL